jgi:hypothetical protein
VSTGSGWAGEVADAAADLYGPERTSAGRPGEYDFAWSSRRGAARFTDLESLPEVSRAVGAIGAPARPSVGPVVFVGVLVEHDVVEIAGFVHDLTGNRHLSFNL